MAGQNGQIRSVAEARPRDLARWPKTRLVEELGWRDAVLDIFQERLAELELAQEDIGWIRESVQTDFDFSRSGLRRIYRQARFYFLKNPLVRRAVVVQAHYVFGQGINISARSEPVNAVIQAFLDDPKNQSELTSHQARIDKEVELQLSGNLFFVLFPNPSTGHVRIRTIPVDEIDEIITNPDDAKETWYYRRVWTQVSFDPLTGRSASADRTDYYPNWRYIPLARPDSIGGSPVHWDMPIYHVKVGGTPGMRFGVPEVYPILDWAKAVKEDLEDFATIRRAHSRFAWRMTTTGGKTGIAAAKAKLGTTLAALGGTSAETNPPPVTGSTFISSPNVSMEPIKTAGAQPLPDDARRLWLMIAAGAGLPETFFGDVSTGNLATAKSLDRPTELKMRDRQTLWADVLTDILSYVIDRAVLAPGGPLDGQEVIGPSGDRIVVLADDPATGEPMDRHIDVTFPPILERDVNQTIAAIVSAATLDGKAPAGTLDQETLVRLLLTALGEDDVDELVARILDQNAEMASQQTESLIRALTRLHEGFEHARTP